MWCLDKVTVVFKVLSAVYENTVFKMVVGVIWFGFNMLLLPIYKTSADRCDQIELRFAGSWRWQSSARTTSCFRRRKRQERWRSPTASDRSAHQHHSSPQNTIVTTTHRHHSQNVHGTTAPAHPMCLPSTLQVCIANAHVSVIFSRCIKISNLARYN